MPRNFNSRVSHVQPDSPVSASNTSQATRDLESRTNYLREVIEAIEAGNLLVLRNQSLHADVEEGEAVYWDDTEKRFDRALAAVGNDETTGEFVSLPSSECLGICLVKDTPSSGTIALTGMVRLSPAVLDNLLDGTESSGRLYLSGTTPGKLVHQRPPVSVPVAYLLGSATACEDDSWLFINPQTRDFMEDHVHYQFELVAEPAGTHAPPTPGDPHVIADADDTQQGWLPADHASFGGVAPAGAKFGYNLEAHTELNQAWPPIPAQNAVLEMLQYDGAAGAEYQGLERVSKDFVTIDSHGIWWMSDCYNQVPWDTTLDTDAEASLGSLSLSSESVSCPVEPATQLLLSFLKMTFATDKTVVTSLRPATDEPFEFVNSVGLVASTGDLYAKLKLLAIMDETLVRGGKALKGIEDSKFRFQQGWITEGLIAGSADVIISGTHQELLDPAEEASASNPTLHQGIVTVDIQSDPAGRELHPQIVKLGDVLEREYRDVTYLGFPNGRDSHVRLRYNVPAIGLPNTPQLQVRVSLFGRADGPLSAMTMSYYRIVKPTDGVPSEIVEGDTSLAFDVVTPSDDYDGGGTDLPANHVIEVESEAFTIEAGDTIFVTLSRAANASPLFQADIGVIRIGGIIVSGA